MTAPTARRLQLVGRQRKTSSLVEVKTFMILQTTKERSSGLSVSEVAKRSGLSISALHFYETKRLIKSMRNAGNHRRYSRDVLRRIAVIRVAQRAGIPLGSIRDALAGLPNGRTPTAKDWSRLSSVWKKELELRIAELAKLRDQLASCIGCGCLSLMSCKLRNPKDELAAQGPGARLLEPDA